jgi:hypothetical protein
MPKARRLRRKAGDYFGIRMDSVRSVHIVTVDAALTDPDSSAGAAGDFHQSRHPGLRLGTAGG